MSAKEENQRPCETNQPVKMDDAAVCDVCGRFGAVQLGDRQLCPDCYGSSGSCCAEACSAD